MPSSGWQPYSLPRHKLESSRLEAQHQLYIKTQGYLLHPDISSNLPSTARITDVGTGTGAWLQELALSAPLTWTLTGFDISDAQFPKSSDGRCDFQLLNILEPIPTELQGQFDVVHIRLLINGLAGEDWSTTAGHVRQLLKPGGWIQWQESNFRDLQVLQLVSGASIKNCQLFANEATRCHNKYGKRLDDVPRLLETVKKAGFEGCRLDLFSSDRNAETRQQMSEIEREALYNTLKHMVERDEELGLTIEQVGELDQRCREELADGKAYYRWDMHIVIGRRPES